MTDPQDSRLLEYLRSTVAVALSEDVGTGDLTSLLVPDHEQIEATVLTRESAVICGKPWFDEVFRQLSSEVVVAWEVSEGDEVAADTRLCQVRGPARPVLTGERTALNFLQFLSGTATRARSFVDAVTGTRATILDTRKTVPGLRLAQKYAVKIGGADNHRIGLFDAFLIKENHIAAAGGIEPAVRAARDRESAVMMEVEVENLVQLQECLDLGVDRVLLDNFDAEMTRRAVELRDASGSPVQLESSGNISLDNVRTVAETGIDYISVGGLTKHVRAVDLTLDFIA